MQFKQEKMEMQVAKALYNWDFNSVENVYKYAISQLDSKNSDSAESKFVYMGYVKFLYQIGKFQEIFYILENYNSMPEWWDNSFDFNLLSVITKYMQDDKVDSENESRECDIEKNGENSKDGNKDSISKIEALPKEMQPYFFAHYVGVKIKYQSLTPKVAMEIFEKMFHDNCIITKAYITVMLIEYFSLQTQKDIEDFFIPIKYASKQYFILSFLHSQDTLGARIYWDKFNTIVRELLQKDFTMGRKRLAVAFYGVLRGAWQENLQEIFDTTIKPLTKDLEVDCFLFSWDEYQQWSSLMGGEIWAERVFGEQVSNSCPKCILTHADFKSLLPNVYYELQSEYNLPIDSKKIEALKRNPEFKKWKLESQENKDFNFYNAKLVYNYQAAFSLIKSYEREKDIEYDYVMILRSDIKTHAINANDIYRLLPNEIADYMYHFGSGSGCFVGFRELIKNYVSMWDNREILSKSRYFASVGENHSMGFKYPVLFNYRIVKPVVTFSARNTTALKSICFPDIKDTLEQDLKIALEKHAITKDDAKDISDFFCMLMTNYKRPSKDSRIYYRLSGEMKDLQALYYALGKMALKNANLLGYFKIPFKHIKIKKHFELRQNDYMNIPNIKDTLEYEVGKALQRVGKNWYRGAYLWFYDKMRRLKKQYRKKV